MESIWMSQNLQKTRIKIVKQQQRGGHSSDMSTRKQEEAFPWLNTREAIQTIINCNNGNDNNNKWRY
jgi:hypothetical protein